MNTEFNYTRVICNQQNSPQNQGVVTERPFQNNVAQLRRAFEARDNAISSHVTTILEGLRITYPNLNERKNHLRGFLDEVKKQRREDPTLRGFPSVPNDLSCLIFRLLTPEEQGQVLPGRGTPVRTVVPLPMVFVHSAEPSLAQIQSQSAFLNGEIDCPWTLETGPGTGAIIIG